jgi:simple sugar transport system substrate-binding protein
MKKANFLRPILCALLFVAFALAVGAEGTGEKGKTAGGSTAPKYTFYIISDMGSGDPNSNWFIKTLAEAEKALPVKVNYWAPPDFSIPQMVEMLNAAIAAKPDGIGVVIDDPVAFEKPMRKAIDMGIPVIAVNMEDPRPGPEKIPYRTYIGADEYQVGVNMGEYLIKRAKEKGQPIKKAVVGNAQPGAVGLELRSQGMVDVFTKNSIPIMKLALSTDPAATYDAARAVLTANPDVNVFWTVAMFSTPYVLKAINDLGRKDQITVATVDDAPWAIENILKGNVVATHGQQFIVQAWETTNWLYLINEYGSTPPPRILTGPVIIDAKDAPRWKNIMVKIFGEQKYNELASGQ